MIRYKNESISLFQLKLGGVGFLLMLKTFQAFGCV